MRLVKAINEIKPTVTHVLYSSSIPPIEISAIGSIIICLQDAKCYIAAENGWKVMEQSFDKEYDYVWY